MCLLDLNVPKLFAVEEGGDKDEAVCRKFSSFLKDYILRCCLQHTLLKKMDHILVRKPSNHILCIQMSESHYTAKKVMFIPSSPPRVQSQTTGMIFSGWF